jgi:hypothetical protein
MEAFVDWLKAPLWGAPHWLWIVTFVVLPGLNELVNRMKWTRAQSILQAVIGVLLKLPVVGRVWIIGDVLRAVATPPAGGMTKLADTVAEPHQLRRPDGGAARMGVVLGIAGIALAFMLASGCGEGGWRPGPVTGATVGDCIGVAPRTIGTIVDGVTRGGDAWATALGAIIAVAPCAQAIARDIFTRPDAPPAVKDRAATTLALTTPIIMHRAQVLTGKPISGAPPTTMSAPNGETMIRGFGR